MVLGNHDYTYGEEQLIKLIPVFSFAPGTYPSGLDLAPSEVNEAKGHLRITDSVITRTTSDALAKKFGCIALFPAAGIRGKFKPGQVLTHTNLFESFAFGNRIVRLSSRGVDYQID